jgi:hypothetical protein
MKKKINKTKSLRNRNDDDVILTQLQKTKNQGPLT